MGDDNMRCKDLQHRKLIQAQLSVSGSFSLLLLAHSGPPSEIDSGSAVHPKAFLSSFSRIPHLHQKLIQAQLSVLKLFSPPLCAFPQHPPLPSHADVPSVNSRRPNQTNPDPVDESEPPIPAFQGDYFGAYNEDKLEWPCSDQHSEQAGSDSDSDVDNLDNNLDIDDSLFEPEWEAPMLLLPDTFAFDDADNTEVHDDHEIHNAHQDIEAHA
ncbi:uncharacterized protein BJ212DRAFT_1474854 [Suillus subaureus]|uniref:Uncharacterized protein n=1 Tax=Suillus subaureus TaxID=48587 RepID=A0A9P7JIY8_9AGAM|nr:uncharacterized protein BJ212DRAFT_1474854 [Suillus subaureus]KAG1825462.1 hypothetical protein BJ212DRAFT_1474854 [Suillus subaureus]